MDKIGSYNLFSNNYLDSVIKNRTEKEKAKTEKSEKNNNNSALHLSKEAKNLLKELKKQYGDTDFIIANYDTDEEAKKYLSRGSKAYSILIEPEELEKMASDKETKKKYLGMIDDAKANLNAMKEQLGDKKEEVTMLGISIDKNGIMSYFANLEKVDNQNKELPDFANGKKRTGVQADSVADLLKKIQGVEWDKIKPNESNGNGSKFDYTI